VPRFRETVVIDDYVIDVLMPDLVGHDQHPAAFLVYVFLYRQAQNSGWRKVSASLRTVAEGTGLSKSAVQIAFMRLQHRELVRSRRAYLTATPEHEVLRHWRERPRRRRGYR
jgi:hypothetical protein